MAYKQEIAGSLKMRDVFDVSLLRAYHKRPELREGAPPALLPIFDLEEEIDEVIDHDVDADNEGWYQVRWVNHGDVNWEPEAHLLKSKGKVKAYFGKMGIQVPSSLLSAEVRWFDNHHNRRKMQQRGTLLEWMPTMEF